MYRQGEILLFAVKQEDIKDIEKDGEVLKTKVIREGEATGHKHEITDGLLYNYGGTMYLKAVDNTELIHPEHKAIHLKPRFYEIRIQREYDEANRWRYIAD